MEKNNLHTDIQLNTLKIFRPLLRKLDSLQVNGFSTTRQYVKKNKNVCSNWIRDVSAHPSNISERVLERRDHTVSEIPSQGNHHEY